MPKIACFLFGHGVEELELMAPADMLRRAGWEVRLVSMEETALVKTRGGFVVQADALFSDGTGDAIDLIVLPGGPGVAALRQRGDLLTWLREQRGIPLAAICAAPLLLHDAGLLAGKRYTSHDSCWGELADAQREDKVVIDGDLITSQGAGTALEFGLALVEKFNGADKRAEITRAIMG